MFLCSCILIAVMLTREKDSKSTMERRRSWGGGRGGQVIGDIWDQPYIVS